MEIDERLKGLREAFMEVWARCSDPQKRETASRVFNAHLEAVKKSCKREQLSTNNAFAEMRRMSIERNKAQDRNAILWSALNKANKAAGKWEDMYLRACSDLQDARGLLKRWETAAQHDLSKEEGEYCECAENCCDLGSDTAAVLSGKGESAECSQCKQTRSTLEDASQIDLEVRTRETKLRTENTALRAATEDAQARFGEIAKLANDGACKLDWNRAASVVKGENDGAPICYICSQPAKHRCLNPRCDGWVCSECTNTYGVCSVCSPPQCKTCKTGKPHTRRCPSPDCKNCYLSRDDGQIVETCPRCGALTICPSCGQNAKGVCVMCENTMEVYKTIDGGIVTNSLIGNELLKSGKAKKIPCPDCQEKEGNDAEKK